MSICDNIRDGYCEYDMDLNVWEFNAEDVTMKEIVKKSIVVFSTVTMIIGTVLSGSCDVKAASGDTVVYITKTGSCYHNSGCSSLSRSCIPTTLEEALDEGLTPCSKCHPASGIDTSDPDDDYDNDDFDDDFDDDYDDDDFEPEYVAVSKITLNKKTASVVKGKTLTLKATIKPANATNKAITWKSSNKKIATVDKNGKVKAIKAGTVKITVTAKDSGKTATCKITVTEPVKNISFSKKIYSVKKGKTITLKYSITPKNASNKKVTFKSSNKKIATVDKNGKVKGIKRGKVTITVTTKDGKKTAKCTVKVQ